MKMTKEKFSPVKEELKIEDPYEAEFSDSPYVSDSYDEQDIEDFCKDPKSRSSSGG